MRTLVSLGLLCAVLAAAQRASTLDAAPLALCSVLAGVLVALSLAAALTPHAITFGAGAAVAHALVAPASAIVAGAAFLALAYGARALRARTAIASTIQCVAAIAAGALASWVAITFADATTAAALIAIGVGALIALAPMLVEIDDPIAYELRQASRSTTGALRWRLLRAAALRARMIEASPDLSRSRARALARAWRALVTLARARVDAGHASVPRLEEQLFAHVDFLERSARALGLRRALAEGLDSGALADLRIESETLEAHAAALAELDGGGATRPPPH